MVVAALVFGCGGDDSSVGDAADEPIVEAGADTFVQDVAPDVAKDVAVEADAGIPPLTCSGELDEPNGTEILATPLGIIDDCDSSGSSVHGVSSGIGDVDWM